MGQLVFQATAGGQVALVGPNPTSNFSLNVPAVNGNLVTTGDTGTVTNTMLASSAYTAPGTIGSGTPNSGAFTTLSASSTVSGTGFSTYLASPPAIGGTSPSTGKFTSITNTGLTATQVIYATTGGLETSSANMTFNGTSLTLANDASISGLTVGKGGGSVASNTVVGNGALASGSQTGAQNTAIGGNALAANTSQNYNTAVGYNAAPVNTTGGVTAFGTNTLFSNTTGSANTALGGYDGSTGVHAALQANTTGSYNIAVGTGALQANTTASNNTAVGYQAGYSGTTFGSNAGFNTFLGAGAGYACTGSSNTLVGANAGVALTSGQGNLIIGGNFAGAAGGAMTTGSKNTLIGSYSGNQGGLDIRTASNYIVLSDGDGNPRVSIPTGTATATIPNATGTIMVSGNMPAFSAYANASQTVSSNVNTKVVLQNKNFDTNNCFDATTNYRFTPTVAGYYQFNAQLYLAGSSTTTQINLLIYKNGGSYYERIVDLNPSASLTSDGEIVVSGSTIMYMNGTTDYVELYGYYYLGTSTFSNNSQASTSRFSGSLVRAA